MIGLIAAMNSELEAVTSRMENISEKNIAGMRFVSGTLEGLECTIVLSGVGKVASAMAATLLCYLYKPEALIHVGVAGGLLQEQKVMDLVISDEIFQADFDTTPIDGPEGLGLVFYTNSNLARAASDVAKAMNISWQIGSVATQDIFLSNPDDFDRLMEKFPTAVCAEMEGGAVAQVAARFEVPFMVLRTLSDVVVHKDNPMQFSEFEAKSALQAGAFTTQLFKYLKENDLLAHLKND